MYIVYKSEWNISTGTQFQKTKHGSTNQLDAIMYAINLCGEDIAEFQKLGKRAKIECSQWGGKIVFTVVGNSRILSRYAVNQ